MFGYEDDLACITDLGLNKTEGQVKEEEATIKVSAEEDSWDSFDWDEGFWSDSDGGGRRKRSESDKSAFSYLTSEGRCRWGMLRELNNTEQEAVRIRTGREDFREKGRIDDIGGRDTFQAWQEDSQCDRYDRLKRLYCIKKAQLI